VRWRGFGEHEQGRESVRSEREGARAGRGRELGVGFYRDGEGRGEGVGEEVADGFKAIKMLIMASVSIDEEDMRGERGRGGAVRFRLEGNSNGRRPGRLDSQATRWRTRRGGGRTLGGGAAREEEGAPLTGGPHALVREGGGRRWTRRLMGRIGR
jgi:hypothetical protein